MKKSTLPHKKLQENVSRWFILVSGVLNNVSKVHQNLITENVKILLTDLIKKSVKFDCTAL